MGIPLNIDWRQILLHLFNFAILFAGLYYLLYKPVKSFMEKRTLGYEELDKKTKASLADAEALKSDYEARLDNIHEEAQKLLNDAELKSVKANNLRIEEAKKQAEQIIKNSREEAEREREEIIAEAKHEVAVIAVTATAKLLEESTGSAFDQFIKAAEGSRKQ